MYAGLSAACASAKKRELSSDACRGRKRAHAEASPLKAKGFGGAITGEACRQTTLHERRGLRVRVVGGRLGVGHVDGVKGLGAHGDGDGR